MSLILDALKRAERERRGEHAPAPEGAPAAAGPRPASPGRWRLLGVATLVLVVAALGWSLWRKPSAPEPQPAPPQPEQGDAPAASPVPQPAPEEGPPEPPTDTAPAVIPGTESVASLEEVTEGVVEAPVVPPAPVSPAPEQAATRAEAQPSQAPVEPETARPIPPALTQPAPLRKLREMPPDYRADFPALTVEVHVFERSPAQRFVMVNGRRYKEGERLAEGPQILEIVREGIVLEFRGQKVLYPLGR